MSRRMLTALLAAAVLATTAHLTAYSSETLVKVMDVPLPAVAYDFSVTDLDGAGNDPHRFVAVFHADPYARGGWGDSVAVRYGQYADVPTWHPGSFGQHLKDQDMVITRAMNSDSRYQSSPTETSVSGAGNPILIYNKWQFWGVHYLTVAQETPGGSGALRHYLMSAMLDYSNPGADLRNIFSSRMYYLANSTSYCPYTWNLALCGIGYQWSYFEPQGGGLGPLAGRSFALSGGPGQGTGDPAPTHDSASYAPIQSGVAYSTIHTWGLMGSMSYTPDINHLYYYYTDVVQEGGYRKMRLLRREATHTSTNPIFYYLTEFAPPVVLKDSTHECVADESPQARAEYCYLPGVGPVSQGDLGKLVSGPTYLKVNYAPYRGKWVVLYSCVSESRGGAADICLQMSANPELSDINIRLNDSDTYGIKFYDDPVIQPHGNNYALGQFNILKDGWGWHNSGTDVVIYVPVNLGSTSVGPAGVSIYAKRVHF